MKVKSGYVKTMMHILITERMRVFLYRELLFLPQLLLPIAVWQKGGTSGLRDVLFKEFIRELKQDKSKLCSNGTAFGCEEEEKDDTWSNNFGGITPWYYYLMSAVAVGSLYFEKKDYSFEESVKKIESGAKDSSGNPITLATLGEEYLKKIWDKLWESAEKPIKDLWEKLKTKEEVYGGYQDIMDSYVIDVGTVEKNQLYFEAAKYDHTWKDVLKSTDRFLKTTGPNKYQNYMPMSFIRFIPTLYKDKAEFKKDVNTPKSDAWYSNNFFTHAFPDLVLATGHHAPQYVTAGEKIGFPCEHRGWRYDGKKCMHIGSCDDAEFVDGGWYQPCKSGNVGDSFSRIAGQFPWPNPFKIGDFALALDKNDIPFHGIKPAGSKGYIVPWSDSNDKMAENIMETPEDLWLAITRGVGPWSILYGVGHHTKVATLWPKDGRPAGALTEKEKAEANAAGNVDPLSSFELYGRKVLDTSWPTTLTSKNNNKYHDYRFGPGNGNWNHTDFGHHQKPYNLWEPVHRSHLGISWDTIKSVPPSAHQLAFNTVSHLFSRYLTTMPGTFIKFLETEVHYTIKVGAGDDMAWTLPAREKNEGFKKDHGHVIPADGGESNNETFFRQNLPGADLKTNALNPENEIDAALANVVRGAGWVTPPAPGEALIPSVPPEKCETDFLS